MIRAALLFAVWCLPSVACRPPKPPVPPDPSAVTCADVCERMSKLDCAAAKPTAEGASCLDVCRNVQDSGIVRWDLACMAHAASCDAVDACN